jgi:hypothetical protein
MSCMCEGVAFLHAQRYVFITTIYGPILCDPQGSCIALVHDLNNRLDHNFIVLDLGFLTSTKSI